MQTIENGAEILQQLASVLGVTDAKADREMLQAQKMLEKIKADAITMIKTVSSAEKAIGFDGGGSRQIDKEFSRFYKEAKANISSLRQAIDEELMRES